MGNFGNSYLIAWLLILVVLVLIELLTMGLTTIWFAGGALVGAVMSLVNLPLWSQILAALIVSIVLLLTTRPLAMKHFNKDRIRTNAESLIGRNAVVLTDIDNIKGLGLINVGGQEWSARSSLDSEKIAAGSIVEIINISGVKLIVKSVEE